MWSTLWMHLLYIYLMYLLGTVDLKIYTYGPSNHNIYSIDRMDHECIQISNCKIRSMATWVGAHPTMDEILPVNPMHTSWFHMKIHFLRVYGATLTKKSFTNPHKERKQNSLQTSQLHNRGCARMLSAWSS